MDSHSNPSSGKGERIWYVVIQRVNADLWRIVSIWNRRNLSTIFCCCRCDSRDVPAWKCEIAYVRQMFVVPGTRRTRQTSFTPPDMSSAIIALSLGQPCEMVWGGGGRERNPSYGRIARIYGTLSGFWKRFLYPWEKEEAIMKPKVAKEC